LALLIISGDGYALRRNSQWIRMGLPNQPLDQTADRIQR
jgi:hypothetical protein